MSMTPESLVEDVNQLVALPDVCFRLNELVEQPYTSVADISALISQDPALTAQLLKIANSPYYGFPSRVDSIARAVTIVGTQDLRDMALAASVVRLFEDFKTDVFDIERFWHHSFLTGLTARQLAAHTTTPVLRRERLFIGGLLHNIGQLVMAMRIEELVRVMVARSNSHHEDAAEVERLVFDLDHAQVGAELLKRWQLPESLQQVVRYHHTPLEAGANLLEASIVHIASAAVSHEVAEDNPYFAEHEVVPETWEITGLTVEVVGDCLESMLGEYLGIENAFLAT